MRKFLKRFFLGKGCFLCFFMARPLEFPKDGEGHFPEPFLLAGCASDHDFLEQLAELFEGLLRVDLTLLESLNDGLGQISDGSQIRLAGRIQPNFLLDGLQKIEYLDDVWL